MSLVSHILTCDVHTTPFAGLQQMWDPHYLQIDPIHDISLELEGPCAMDGQKFANRHWEYVESEFRRRAVVLAASS